MWVIRASSKTKKGKQCLAEKHKPPFLVQLVLAKLPTLNNFETKIAHDISIQHFLTFVRP